MSRRQPIFTCSCCYREYMQSKGFRNGMCKSCRTQDTDVVDIDVNEDLISPAEDHDMAYNGTYVDTDFDDVSFD